MVGVCIRCGGQLDITRTDHLCARPLPIEPAHRPLIDHDELYHKAVALLIDGNTVSTREGREQAVKTVFNYARREKARELYAVVAE